MSYTHENIIFDTGILDDIIDILYIITMKTSKDRHVSVYDQLYKYKLCKKCVIIYNSGYKHIPKYIHNKKV